jgi:hypothetical protein
MLFSLLLLSLTLVYLDATNIPLNCTITQDHCEVDCRGEFSIDYCWESEGHTYCFFWCYFDLENCQWWTQTPVYEICIL